MRFLVLASLEFDWGVDEYDFIGLSIFTRVNIF